MMNMNSKNVTMFTYTHHIQVTRTFFQTINLQYAGCGQARGVKPKAERRGGTLAYSVPPRASPEVPVWRSAFPKSAGMAFRCVPAQFKHCLYSLH